MCRRYSLYHSSVNLYKRFLHGHLNFRRSSQHCGELPSGQHCSTLKIWISTMSVSLCLPSLFARVPARAISVPSNPWVRLQASSSHGRAANFKRTFSLPFPYFNFIPQKLLVKDSIHSEFNNVPMPTISHPSSLILSTHSWVIFVNQLRVYALIQFNTLF